MGWNYLSIPKLQQGTRWSLVMDKWFHHTLYKGCNYLSMPGLDFIYVSKRGLWTYTLRYVHFCVSIHILTVFSGLVHWHWGNYVKDPVLAWRTSLIARFMGPTWGPSGADMTQVGPMLAPWNLQSGMASRISCTSNTECSITDTIVCMFHWIYYLINVSVNMTLQC